MTDHAKFSPSSAHRWMPCPGSIALEGTLPQGRTSSVYADEGTVAHEVGSQCLQNDWDAARFVGLSGQVDADGKVTFAKVKKGEETSAFPHLVDDDFANNVQVYLDYVRGWVALGYTLLVEQRVEFSKAIGVPDQFGTSDTVLVSPDGTHVIVVDLKFGMGEKVYAKQNHQMLSYGVGTDETLGGLVGDFETMTLVVCQPRIDHIDEWPTADDPPLIIQEVRAHGRAMALAAYAAQNAVVQWGMGEAGREIVKNQHLHPGEKTCRWCKAAALCPKIRELVSDAVFEDLDALDRAEEVLVAVEPELPEGERLGAIYNILPVIERFSTAVRAEVERRVFAGEHIIGVDGLPLRLGEGRKGHRFWTDKDMVEGLLAGFLPPEKFYEPKEIQSPSKIGKVLDKKRTADQWTALKAYIDQPAGKVKVLLGSDPAPAYVGEAKAEEFADMDDPSL